MFNGVFNQRNVIVTGHTGFKGSWLTLWLEKLGARVTGVSLPPNTTPNHWSLLNLSAESQIQDIKNLDPLKGIISRADPSIIFHLAAQPLVRKSYQDPILTWSTNVMGTANVLEASRCAPNLKAIIVVTTDKCYENREWVWGYRENDPLGGNDPYSASKGATELLVSSYRSSFFNLPESPLLASARAGNVIGGGDWSDDRLIPDLIRALIANQPLIIRNPNSTRPWQHVLDCLSGYLLLGKNLLEGKREHASAWNFGPDISYNKKVHEMLLAFKEIIPDINYNTLSPSDQLHEAQLLHLDSSKARKNLSWSSILSFDETIENTAAWYKAWAYQGDVTSISELEKYWKIASDRNAIWT